jgi:hypothetical protein
LKHTDDTAPAAAVSSNSLSDAVAVVSTELDIDENAAEQIVRGCRTKTKTITAAEIVVLAQMKIAEVAGQIRKGKIQNVTGLLIRHLPMMAAGATLRKAKAICEEQKQQRAEAVTYIREHWSEYSQEEQHERLHKYPELADLHERRKAS